MNTVLAIVFFPVALVIMALTGQTPDASPDLAGIAALVTAGVAFLGFLATLYRGMRNNTRVEEVEQAADYVSGFDNLVNRLEREINELREEHRGDRDRWQEERSVLNQTIAELKAELLVARGEWAQLDGRIKGFLSAEDYRRFKEMNV